MWNPIKIEIYNLFAHKESVYEFKNNTCTVIFGKNETDRNLENNGAGKSTLIEAISIALTNESLRAIKKETFINREEEECKIVFHLYNPVMKLKLKIVRKFFRGNRPVKVEIWENDELNKQITSVNEANKRVFELIGISREDLLRYFIISQDSSYTFFTASDVEKKEIMNRITSADMIKPVIEELSLRMKAKDAERSTIERELGKLSDKLDVLKEQRQEMLANDDTDEKIKELDEKINQYKNNLLEIDDNIKSLKNDLLQKTNEISKIEVEDIIEIRSICKKYQSECDDIEKELSENKRVERKLNDEIQDIITCPNCEHEFIHESEFNLSVEEVEALIEETKNEIEKQEKILVIKNNKLKEIKLKIPEAERKNELVERLEEEKRTLKVRLKRKDDDKKYTESRIEVLKEEKKYIKNKNKDDKMLNGLNQRILECEEEIQKINKDLTSVVEEIEKIKYWQFHMGKMGFMTYLANKSIKIIEGITNSFLKKFNVDISVLINGFTVLKSEEIREKIDIFVMSDGVTAEAFWGKSGGERGRVMLAGVLGIQHLINLSTNGKGLNLLCLDECFHGMDSKGQENIIKIFEKIGITILLITQNVSDSFNNENTLYVVKEKGVSRYIK